MANVLVKEISGSSEPYFPRQVYVTISMKDLPSATNIASDVARFAKDTPAIGELFVASPDTQRSKRYAKAI
ncbi:hypothetical protein HYX05_00885 [Candidatus Woesearchaeota archaeon]|nr:hypothetical protein [Candidatus Woesearchaeota archaeon]